MLRPGSILAAVAVLAACAGRSRPSTRPLPRPSDRLLCGSCSWPPSYTRRCHGPLPVTFRNCRTGRQFAVASSSWRRGSSFARGAHRPSRLCARLRPVAIAAVRRGRSVSRRGQMWCWAINPLERPDGPLNRGDLHLPAGRPDRGDGGLGGP
jgi:hypothetical protein